MGLKQLRSVIQWVDPDPEYLLEQWSESSDEIKNASKLIVGPGEGCILVVKGQIVSVCDHEGVTEVTTGNIPFWTTLTKVMQGFESENKTEIWFYRRNLIAAQKFGTPSPVKYQDPVYDIPVALRAFGNFSFKITDPSKFLREVTGRQELFATDDLRRLINTRLFQTLTTVLALGAHSYSDLDSKRESISALVLTRIQTDMANFGLTMTDFRIDGTSFDEDTMRRINRIADLKAEAKAAVAVGLDYTELKNLENGIKEPTVQDPMDALKKLKALFEAELINETEFETKKKEILSRI